MCTIETGDSDEEKDDEDREDGLTAKEKALILEELEKMEAKELLLEPQFEATWLSKEKDSKSSGVHSRMWVS